MTRGQLAWLSAADLARGYRSGEFTPLEATDACLDRIDARNPVLNAFITITADRAREQARAATERHRQGRARGSLDGVPFAAKDLFATRGIRTTHGSKLARDDVARASATAIDRLEAAGAVLLGKTNLYEFGTGSGTESGFGPVHNPWRQGWSPGSSSSGNGAALAAGLAPLALGTDTGGSVRLPAHACGVVGLKPTYGRVSLHGVTPLAWSLDHAGPMARTVRDVARLLGAIAGFDPLDATSAREPVPDFERGLSPSTSLTGRRFAVVREMVELLDPAIAAHFDGVCAQLTTLGAVRVDASMPSAIAANIASEVIIESEAAVFHERNLRDPERRQLLDPLISYYLNAGRLYLATDYVKAQRLRSQLQAELNAVFGQADVIAAPSDPALTPSLDGAVTVSGRSYEWFELGTVNLANLTGAPALSVPCGFTPDGLPIGLQLIGPAFEEGSLLAFAHAWESAVPMTRRPPE
jgi:aspartyl-tRNA(Asn)/glutamyl-tRNA(Gln) amidotransferase subunit A